MRQYKKECPLCKEQMKTHRELRPYTKMQEILTLLLPLIEKENEKVQIQTDVVELTHKMQKE